MFDAARVRGLTKFSHSIRSSIRPQISPALSAFSTSHASSAMKCFTALGHPLDFVRTERHTRSKPAHGHSFLRLRIRHERGRQGYYISQRPRMDNDQQGLSPRSDATVLPQLQFGRSLPGCDATSVFHFGSERRTHEFTALARGDFNSSMGSTL